MAFEELPPDYDAFFKTGVVPDALKVDPPPAPAPKTPDPAPVAKTPDPAPAPAPTPPNLDVYDHALRLAENQRRSLEAQITDLNGKLTKLTATPAPDPNVDPLGFINHQMKTLQDQLSALTETQTNAAKQTQEQQQQSAFIGAVNNQIKSFEASTPDYQEAYRHMISMRTQDYIDSGMTASEAKAAVGNDEISIAARALQQGKNPAEVVYGMAKRYGYKPAEAPATKKGTENKLDTIKKGMEASKTIERDNQPTDVTLESLEGMGDSELNEMVESQWEKLFGKPKGIFG